MVSVGLVDWLPWACGTGRFVSVCFVSSVILMSLVEMIGAKEMMRVIKVMELMEVIEVIEVIGFFVSSLLS